MFHWSLFASDTPRRTPRVGPWRRTLPLCALAILVGLSAPLSAANGNASDARPARDGSLIEQQGLLMVADREQPYALIAPSSGESLPIVLFSHGAYSSKDLYLDILRPWAEAGFIVIAPTHADSVSLGTARGGQNPNFYAWRVADLQAIINQLPRLLADAQLVGRADPSRIAATGHSFGGWVAQTLAGATSNDPTGASVAINEPRIKMAILHSAAGVMPGLLTEENFTAMQVPVLVTVGTDDLAQMPGLSGYEWRRQPFDLLGSRERWLLVQEGADHYLGGRVGRDDLPRSPYAEDYLQDFLWVSILALRAWLAEDREAQKTLDALRSEPSPASLRRGRLEQSSNTD